MPKLQLPKCLKCCWIPAAMAFWFGAASYAYAGASLLAPGPHDAPLGDVTLHYVVAGSGSVLIVPSPGWGPGSLYLRRGLAPLEANHTMVYVDSRGSGGSSRPADARRMTVSDNADDIEQLRRFLNLPSIDLLGHSFGGATGIDYAERYPATLRRLILVDSAVLDNNEASKEEDADSQKIRARLSSDPRYAAAIRHMQDWVPPANDAAMMKALQDEAAFEFANPLKNVPKFAKDCDGMQPSSWAQRNFFQDIAARQWHQEEKLGHIHAAVLVVNGRQDWMVPELVAEHLHSGIAGSRMVLIDASGHFPWIEQPAVFFPAVDRFLAEAQHSNE